MQQPSSARDAGRGDQGPEVRKIQELLQTVGMKVTVDGLFGAATEQSVRRFQEQRGLEVTGRVDAATLDALARSADQPDRNAGNPTNENIPNAVQQSKAAAPRTSGSERPFDPVTFFRRLSPSSRGALGVADGMKSTPSDRVHMEQLIMGLFLKQDGPAEKLFKEAGIDNEDELRTVLGESVEAALPRQGSYTPTELTELPGMSGHAQIAIEAAQAIADEKKSVQIQSRHLLYGALSIEHCHVIKALLDRGIRKEEIDLGDRTIPEVDEGMIAGCSNDVAGGKDLLSIDDEVDALSALVAAREVKPPLSIGLFGDWGSGKSFFMQEMEKRINALRDEARGNDSSPFCPHIVQLWFNAWHYIDKSLWATLGAQIFDGLAQSLTDEEVRKRGISETQEQRTLLLAQKTVAENKLAEAKQAADAAEGELAERQRVVDETQNRTDAEIEKSLGTKAVASEIVRFVSSQPGIKEQLDQGRKQLGLDPLSEAAGNLDDQIKETLELASFGKGVISSLTAKGSARFWVISVVVLVIGLVAGSWILTKLLVVGPYIAAVTSALVAIVARIAPVLAKARSAAKVVADARDSLKTKIDAARQQRVAEAEQERKEAEDLAVAKRKEVEAVTNEVADLNEKLDKLMPDRRLSDFIQSRNKGDEYRKYFGVIARARQDFEELTRLMGLVENHKPDEAKGERAMNFPPINRIVLYIDDLDRCPERKVFQVLQAVHLLLAFPLFVVVVGVDSRWLLHSLRQQLAAFNSMKEEETTEEERNHWQSTPLSYLEKIFQIPFALRRMDRKGYDNLIDDLSKAGAQPPPHGETLPLPPPAQDGQKGTVSATETGTATGEPAKLPAQEAPGEKKPSQMTTEAKEAKQAVAKARGHLRLEDWERTHMKRLYVLLPSPRATKRYVNVYRLLRATVRGADRDRLINPNLEDHRLVLLLLAMLTGYPAQTTEIIRQLVEGLEPSAAAKLDWWKFIDNIEKQVFPTTEPELAHPPGARRSTKVFRTDRPPISHELEEDTEEGDRAQWRALFEDLRVLRIELEDTFTCAEMQRWAPAVARYSFASGRLFLNNA
ncbi:MAG TPA: P-loop NTPase fold protein [Gemmatimonadales bacterium]|jgi:hypothetical protein